MYKIDTECSIPTAPRPQRIPAFNKSSLDTHVQCLRPPPVMANAKRAGLDRIGLDKANRRLPISGSAPLQKKNSLTTFFNVFQLILVSQCFSMIVSWFLEGSFLMARTESPLFFFLLPFFETRIAIIFFLKGNNTKWGRTPESFVLQPLRCVNELNSLLSGVVIRAAECHSRSRTTYPCMATSGKGKSAIWPASRIVCAKMKFINDCSVAFLPQIFSPWRARPKVHDCAAANSFRKNNWHRISYVLRKMPVNKLHRASIVARFDGCWRASTPSGCREAFRWRTTNPRFFYIFICGSEGGFKRKQIPA